MRNLVAFLGVLALSTALAAPAITAEKKKLKPAEVRAACIAWLKSIDKKPNEDVAAEHPDRVAKCVKKGGPPH